MKKGRRRDGSDSGLCQTTEGRGSRRLRWSLVWLLTILLLTGAIRFRFLAVPLERDEGEYAYAGQLILQGIPPYAQVYNMKMPGIYAAYALIEAVFGQTVEGIHLGLLVVNACTIVLVFLLANRLFGQVAAVAAAAAFALISVGLPVQGIFANAEHFVLLPALGGILLLLRAVNTERLGALFASGLLLGLAFLAKQHGAGFVAFAGTYLLVSEARCRPFQGKLFLVKSSLFLAGVLLPFAATCLILYGVGVFDKFWFWTFDYAREYVSRVPLSGGWTVLKMRITRIAGSAILVWVLAGIGLTALLWNKKARPHSIFVTGFVLFSFLAVCPGLYFREHYFILLLPAVALLAGIAMGSFQNLFVRNRQSRLQRGLFLVIAVVPFLHGLYQQREFLLVMDPTAVCRAAYGENPFPESLEIARHIRERTTKEDRIAVIGSEPQIYFYSRRRAATGHIYMYALMEEHKFASEMQQQMIHEVESARPKYVVRVNIPASWLVRPDSVKDILGWTQRYLDSFYEIDGVVDIVSTDKTVYLWSDEVRGYEPRSKYWLSVFRRKEPM